MANTYQISGILHAAFLYDNAGTVTEADIYYTNNVEFETDIATIQFEGDGSTRTDYSLNELRATIAADSLDMPAIETIFDKTAVTVGLPSGIARRTYMGEDAEGQSVICGLRVRATAKDVDTNASVVLRIEVPRGTLSAVTAPTLANKAKSTSSFQFASIKGTADIAGTALPGVPADGCHWFVDEES